MGKRRDDTHKQINCIGTITEFKLCVWHRLEKKKIIVNQYKNVAKKKMIKFKRNLFIRLQLGRRCRTSKNKNNFPKTLNSIEFV